MRDAAGVALYVGKAKNLRQRLNCYRVANPDRLRRRHLRLLRAVEHIDLEECADEAAALAREAELLRSLKPRFNRAGVWPASPRFHLVWRCQEQRLELAIAETPANGWQSFGPFGKSVVHFRVALARLMWQAMHPDDGLAALPCGWIHGRMEPIATVTIQRNREPQFAATVAALKDLFAGNEEAFTNWVAECTKALVKVCDLELRDSNLETVLEFVQAKARRPKVLPAPEAILIKTQKKPHPDLPLAMLDRCPS